MKELKASTKAGQRVIEMASLNIGTVLADVYERFSSRKLAAFADCFEEYIETHGENWHICSRNVNRFTVAWSCMVSGEPVIMVRTGMTDYMVWLER